MITIDIIDIRGEVDGHPFVLLQAGLIGCCELGLARETAGLRRLWVAPHVRGCGIGTRLFLAAQEIAAAEGSLALSWTVKKDNLNVIRFYERHGGRVVHDPDDGYYWMAISLREVSR